MADIKDFLIIIEPSHFIKKRFRSLKNETTDLIGSYASSNSIAHITVCYIANKPAYFIQEVIDVIERRINNLPSIDIAVDGFDMYDQNGDTNTVYARVVYTNELLNWTKVLDKIIKLRSEFHLTVAKSINKKQSQLVWARFKDRQLREHFRPSGITILGRESGKAGATYHQVKKILFKA